jgi:A/G-specific adenine glycosylase
MAPPDQNVSNPTAFQMDATKLSHSVAPFQSQLINWYGANARDLPWRKEPSLYKTVVSEFMLQQTQVKTALPYFDAWLKVYPNFKKLAKATEDQVLKSWEGLGYYSRARNLHKLAKTVSNLPELPTDSKSWQAFPGIGPYAAAAVCSISFSDPSAVVDGNVVRILSRLIADAAQYKTSVEAAKAYQSLAETLLNTARPGDHNQAMMELGATVCRKANPQCLLCPVVDLCEGRIAGIESSLPRFDKTKTEKKTVDRAFIVGPKGILLHKIPESAKRMKGLHEIPSLEQLALTKPIEKLLIERKRSITKYRITERFFPIDLKTLPKKLPPDSLWVKTDAIDELPFSGPHRKWIQELLAQNSS